MSGCISYANTTTSYTRWIPVHLQRLMIQQYCKEQSLHPRFEQLEIEVMTHLPTLLHVIEVDRPDAVVLFSIWALPEEADLRAAILDAAVSNGVALHFANESEQVQSAEDVARLERLVSFSGPPVAG